MLPPGARGLKQRRRYNLMEGGASRALAGARGLKRFLVAELVSSQRVARPRGRARIETYLTATIKPVMKSRALAGARGLKLRLLR